MSSARDHGHLAGALRILMVFQNDFRAPSEKQALGFAQELALRGHSVMMTVGKDPDTVHDEGDRDVGDLGITGHRFAGPRLRRRDLAAARAFRPDLIHCWNSRITTVVAARQFARATRAPVFVHFEDDEWEIPPQGFAGERTRAKLVRAVRRRAWPLHPQAWWHTNRASLRWVSKHAVALDALTPAIAAEVRVRLARECEVVLPVSPRPPAADESAAGNGVDIRLPEGPLAVYTGALLPVHLPDIMLALRAVAMLQAEGRQITFVYAGDVYFGLDTDAVAAQAGLQPGHYVFLGYLPVVAIRALLRAATVLLQPGRPVRFNRLRLPSKLQSYLASGTPTITFATGFGELLRDRNEVLKTESADPRELADRIAEVLDDEVLRSELARGGPAAASRLFDIATNTDAMERHYRAGLARALGESSVPPAANRSDQPVAAA